MVIIVWSRLYYMRKQPVLVIWLTGDWEVGRYLVVGIFGGDFTDGVFDAGEGLEVGVAGIARVGWFGEVGEGFAWAVYAPSYARWESGR